MKLLVLRSGSFGRVALGLCLAVSVLINVRQGTRLLQLQKPAPDSLPSLVEGSRLPPLEARSLAGENSIVRYDSSARPTVLYVFSPDCVWCNENNERMLSLTTQIASNYSMVGVSLSSDGLHDYVERHHIPFPVYADLSDRTLASYKLGATPETIVVSRDGRVLASWYGSYIEPTRSLVERFFSIRLPGA